MQYVSGLLQDVLLKAHQSCWRAAQPKHRQRQRAGQVHSGTGGLCRSCAGSWPAAQCYGPQPLQVVSGLAGAL